MGYKFENMAFCYKRICFFFKFYLIDLPGIGINTRSNFINIDKTIKMLYRNTPRQSIWLGWSMGGLIASQLALTYPEHVLAIISVSSSPCFIEKKNWPGIKKYTAYHFYINLKEKYYQTINNFFMLEKINSKKNFRNSTVLENILHSQSQPSTKTLRYGLEIICSSDIRLEMSTIKVPVLRIYGSLDHLVPKKIVEILDKTWPRTYSIVIEKASHMPFLSHTKYFFSILLKFKNFVLK